MIHNVTPDIFAETSRLIESNDRNKINYFFVVAHTINGGRFYSEPLNTFEEATKIFKKYENMVYYFDGGSVELLSINDSDYDVVSIKRI